jgi:Domain of Kin17 curved DNA-binding protein
VYNEFIADRHHIHMNSTKWYTLTDFVKYLGREGLCKVDETPKGWFISLIHRDPVEEIEEQKRLARRKAEKVPLACRRHLSLSVSMWGMLSEDCVLSLSVSMWGMLSEDCVQLPNLKMSHCLWLHIVAIPLPGKGLSFVAVCAMCREDPLCWHEGHLLWASLCCRVGHMRRRLFLLACEPCDEATKSAGPFVEAMQQQPEEERAGRLESVQSE